MTDATRCAVCGGEFSAKRVHIEDRQYHPSCAVMSYPPHTSADMAAASDRIAELEAETRSLLNTLLTIAEGGDSLAQSVVDSYKRNGRDLVTEFRTKRAS